MSFLARRPALMRAIVCVSCSIIFYLLLTYLSIAPKITIALSVFTPILIFGLIRYYACPVREHGAQNGSSIPTIEKTSRKQKDISWFDIIGPNFNFIFILMYGSFLMVCVFSNLDSQIFTDWSELGIFDLIKLGAAVMLTCFIPGYAIMQMVFKEGKLLPKIIVAYLLSLLITGSIEY